MKAPIVTGALNPRDWIAHQQKLPGETTHVFDLTRPPTNRLERRVQARLLRRQQKLK